VKTKPHAELSAEALEGLSPPLRAWFECARLKQLFRQGWLQHGVPEASCESVADHAFGVVLLALFLVDEYFPELDRNKVLLMAILHDLAEAYVGDLTPADDVTPAEKHQRENDALERITKDLHMGVTYREIWHEFEAQQSPEARFVKQIDRLEMALQASRYENNGYSLAPFFASAEQALSDERLKTLLREI